MTQTNLIQQDPLAGQPILKQQLKVYAPRRFTQTFDTKPEIPDFIREQVG